MTPREIAAAAQLACVLEASASKPGNVSPGRRFADLAYEDFLAAAAAIGEPLADAGRQALGLTIRRAVEATHGRAGTNVNLGIVLLLAPLVRAVIDLVGGARGAPDGGGPERPPLRPVIRRLLEQTTVEGIIPTAR